MASTETSTETITNVAELELIEFKRKVRARAIVAYRDGDWCLGGLNEALEELGLQPYLGAGAWTGTAQLDATVHVRDDYDLELTEENIRQYVEPKSNDSDVTIVIGDIALVGFTKHADIPAVTVAVKVPVRVTDTEYEDTATGWVEDALHLRQVARGVLVSGKSVSQVELANYQ